MDSLVAWDGSGFNFWEHETDSSACDLCFNYNTVWLVKMVELSLVKSFHTTKFTYDV